MKLYWWGKPWNQPQGLSDTNSFHLIPKQKDQPTWAVWNNVGWSKAAQLTPVLLWRCLLKWIFSKKTLIILDLKSSVTSKFTCFVFMSLPAKSCCNNKVRESRWKVHTTCDDRWARKSPRQLKGDTFGSLKRSQEWKGFTLPPGSTQTVSFCHQMFSVWQMAITTLWKTHSPCLGFKVTMTGGATLTKCFT